MTIRSLLLASILLAAAQPVPGQQYAYGIAAGRSSEDATLHARRAAERAAMLTAERMAEARGQLGGTARFPQDPADSTYREARSLLNRGEWRRAATLFAQVAGRQPASAYAVDALYWQAFALYRIGGLTELQQAQAALDARKARFPRAGNAEEAESLAARVNGALAARGDAAASQRVRAQAAGTGGSCDSEELSVRASALSTLMRNDPDAAMPIVTRILSRRDDCSVSLRRSAVMILGRREDAAARGALAGVATGDPSDAVRSDAIGYLAGHDTDETAATLEGIARGEGSVSVQRSAVRALGTMRAPRARAAIRALVERASAPERLRLDAIAGFDRRAAMQGAYTWSFACGDGDCAEFPVVAEPSGQFELGITTPRPPRPVTAPAVAPGPAVAPVPPVPARGSAASPAAAEAEARAVAEAARTRAAAPAPRMAYTIADQEVERALRASIEDRTIAADDAAWLRGVYPRLESPRLKSAAVAVLARAGDEATRTWVANLIQREEEPAEVRAAALARVGGTLPVAQLARVYDGAASRAVRMEIVEILGARPEPEATDKLIEVVRTGTDPQLRRAAITALNGKKDPRTTRLLLELIDR